MEPVNLLREHEKWANRVCSTLVTIFAVCAVPVFFVLQNVPWRWRIILSVASLFLGYFLIFVGKNKQTSEYTKYITAIFLNVFGFIMTITMGEGNRSVPFYFFSILAFSLIYLQPDVILTAFVGTILSHWIMMSFFPDQIFALHQPAMYIYAGFIYLLYALVIYTIARKARQLLDNLKQREEETRKLNEDLTEIQYQIASSAARLHNASQNLANEAGNLMSAFHETASAIEQMAQMVDVETGEVTKVSNAVIEINEIADRIKQMSDQLTSDFIETEKVFQQGSSLMYSTIDGMKKVSTQIDEVAKATWRLKDSSLKINDILSFMNEIADKTTLLSLNANIEAARAGQAGHGFAVVATEISKLSVQSARGTEEIKNIIDAILLDLEKVVEAIDLSLAIVEKNTEDSNTVTTEITNMMANIRQNSAQIKGIYDAMEKLAQMSNTIMAGANSLAAIAEETSASTEEISATTQNQTKNVDKIVEQSKTLEQMASSLDALVNPDEQLLTKENPSGETPFQTLLWRMSKGGERMKFRFAHNNINVLDLRKVWPFTKRPSVYRK